MIAFEIMVSEYLKDGYSELFAEARVCQDIVLKAIIIIVIVAIIMIKLIYENIL